MLRPSTAAAALSLTLLAAGSGAPAFAADPAAAPAPAPAPTQAAAAAPLAASASRGLAGAAQPPALEDAVSYVLMDAETGAIIASKQPELAHAPASLTKLMTAYLTYQAIARGTLKMDQTVPVDTAAWQAGGSRMFLKPGVTVTVDQLLHGLIIESGNDAAVALAEAVGGTQEAFVANMNAEAAKLGLTGTHYTDVTGLPDPELHTTALDVAKLSRAIVRDYPQFLQISAQKDYTFDNIKQRSWNPVLFRDPTVDGLKTGLTDAAGHCIAATAVRGGRRLIAVELGSPSWSAGTKASEVLLDYGYFFTSDVKTDDASKPLGQVTDPRFDPETIPVGAMRDLTLTVPASLKDKVTPVLHLSGDLPTSLPKGAQVGTITYMAGGTVLATVPAVTLAEGRPAGLATRLLRQVKAAL
ncbi:D-alanyl-D-alanine carboxypeptidase [Thioclava sp. BHET1]|nr:D-alanyl-D-alanine carboxypeptidase [Thioclava sp. BHET1]